MKMLSGAAMLLAANVCSAVTITQAPADWTTYRVDLVADSNYEAFGGGPAGDIFHVYFDFNRAYLPYITSLVTDGWDCGTYGGFGGMTCFDGTTEDPNDLVQFDDLAIHGSRATFEINGRFILSGSPYAIYVDSGAISSIGMHNLVWVQGEPTDFRVDATEFYFIEAAMTPGYERVSGHVAGIVDLGRLTQVPEPGTMALFGLGLLGIGSRVVRRKAA